ncbi:MAG: M48 family metalloprotease [Candidatus Aegiribacteria sp.]|nr:M48 family metalloprotease [Candidatus Aegiribacteria sp.]
MTYLSIIISALLAFGLGDVVDILESDEVESALDVAESFQRASREITEVEEYYIGRSVAAVVINMYVPLEDPAMQQYINLVGQTVACSSPKPTIFGGYHFLVLNSSDINAIACPGGLIFVCSGLINMASNEDELAPILAHEVAHVTLQHGISSIDQARWTEFGALVAQESTERWGSSEVQNAANDYGDIVEDVVSNIITKGYSRETEYQADSLAAEICASAGYDPHALASVLESMCAIDSRSGPGFWQTHPSPEDRLAAVNAVIAALPQRQIDPVRTTRFNEYTSGSVSVPDPVSETTGTGRR